MASFNNTNATSNNIQTNFNPSWMQQTGPRTVHVTNNQPKSVAESEETQTCDPIFAKHSYGREDLLAMIGKDATKPPNGIEKCTFFVETPQTPVVLTTFTETEMRLQQNMNSSKAMSAFNRMTGTETSISGGTSGTTTHQAGGIQPVGVTRKYQPQQQENKPQQQSNVSNRWSALASSNAVPPQKLAWKNGQQNTTGNGGSGSFDRTVFREKPVSGNQLDRTADVSGKKLQRKEIKSHEQPNLAEENSEHLKANMVNNDSLNAPTTTPPKSVIPKKSNEDIQTAVQQSTSQHSDPSTESAIKQPTQLYQQQQDKWNYLDPSGVQRGPFDTQQMQAWFSSGYFTASLQVRRTCDARYITLGDLFRINGEQTPFVVKPGKNMQNQSPNAFENAASIIASTNTEMGHHLQQQSPTDLLGAAKSSANAGTSLGIVDVERIWATTPLEDIGTSIPPTASINSTGFVHSAFSQHMKEFELEKSLQTKEVQILEEQRKLREKEELLRRDEQERTEKERQILEMESELKRKQEELERMAREKDTEFEKRCIQMAEYERKKRDELIALEQRILTEQQRQQLRMEEEDRRRAKELHELLAREQERQRKMLEAETHRKREEEEIRMRLQLQEAQHLKELAQEQVRRAEEEQRRRLIEEQQKQQQKALETARAERIRQQEVAAKAEAAARAEQKKIDENAWKYAMQQQQQQHVATSNVSNVQPQKSQQQHTRSAWQTVNVTTPPQPLQMNFPAQPSVENKLPAQSSATLAAERERKGWQQVSMPKAAPIPPAIIGKNNSGSAAAVGKQRHSDQKSQQNTKEKRGNNNKQQQPQCDDKLTAWIIKRVKDLNSSVDAEVFANFIAQIDSPNEAEDYIIGYLGDKKEVKDFHREFLNKRIELRPRVQQTHKDDLSRPAAALNTDAEHLVKISASSSTHSKLPVSGTGTNGNNTSGAGKKKKQKKVLDPSSLGFRAVPDPNRVNAGEIDSVPIVLPGTNRKR